MHTKAVKWFFGSIVFSSVLGACTINTESSRHKNFKMQYEFEERSAQCLKLIHSTNDPFEKLRNAYSTKEFVCVLTALTEAEVSQPPPGFFLYLLKLVLSVDAELAQESEELRLIRLAMLDFLLRAFASEKIKLDSAQVEAFRNELRKQANATGELEKFFVISNLGTIYSDVDLALFTSIAGQPNQSDAIISAAMAAIARTCTSKGKIALAKLIKEPELIDYLRKYDEGNTVLNFAKQCMVSP